MLKSKITQLLLAVLTLFSVAISAEPASGRTKRITFPKVKDAVAALECMTPQRVFAAGEKPVIRLRFKNFGLNKFTVYEWMMEEGHNIRYYYAETPELGKDEKPDFSAIDWKRMDPKTEEKPQRAILDLNPKNAVFVNKELDFVEDVKLEKNEQHREYLVYFELNLKSVDLKSEVIKIAVKSR